MASGSDVNTFLGLCWRGEKKKEKVRERKEDTTGDVCSTNAKLTIAQSDCVCVCVSISLSVCICLGSSELQAFLQSHHSGEWRENTKDTLRHKSTSPPTLSVPLGKVILSAKTFSSLLRLSLLLFFSFSLSLSVRLVFHSAIPTLSLYVCVLSGLVSLLWANLCQC